MTCPLGVVAGDGALPYMMYVKRQQKQEERPLSFITDPVTNNLGTNAIHMTRYQSETLAKLLLFSEHTM